MATCYRCGRQLGRYERRTRRRLRVGETTLRLYASERLWKVSSRFGMRIVCSDCQRQMAAAELRQDLLHLAQIAGAVVVITGCLLVLLWAM